MTQFFGLLKNGFFAKTKELASNERIKKAEIEAKKEVEILKQETDKEKHLKTSETESSKISADKEIKQLEAEQKRDYIELAFECGDKKYNFKLTKDDAEQHAKIIETIAGVQQECE